MEQAGNTLDEARTYAAKLSAEHRGQYVTLAACFGLFAHLHKRLSVHAPSDSVGGCYWLNGKAHPFTGSQRGADERATPSMT